ncbi:MAG TPA: FKBP-type peptidyl-prolyl cis-trans isomerase [candidate division Zixibacteria bacterium]|nr:FKBP-type peptidyl-prolyl cis-trans isomerase [candidate division Zixibacteria bacterium]
MIKDGSVVSFEYTLSDEEGNVLETNVGEEPVTYTHGRHEIIPGLENGMSGMEINEKRRLRVQPEDGYGPVHADYFKEVPRDEIPASGLIVGTVLRARGPHGEDFSVRVHEIKDHTVVLDLNHPLAGKVLNFEVRVLSIEPGEAE